VCRGELLQVIERLPNGDYIAVLSVYVVEVRLVGVGVAVAYGFAGDDGTEAVLEGVDSSCADASRGGRAGDDECIYAGGGEEAGEARAEEARGEEFVEDWLRFLRGYARIDLSPSGSGLQGQERRHFVYEGGGGEFVALAVGDGGEGNGDLRPPGCPQELLDL
jgi:hypothetical protein